MSDGIEQAFASIQHQAISEVVHLLDGFYENLEHGLFELAFHLDDQTVQSRCALAMKDLRLQKAQMMRRYTELMEADGPLWTSATEVREDCADLIDTARVLALKHENHFHTVLRSMARCVSLATNREDTDVEIPIRPQRLACHFVRCFTSTGEEPELASMLNDLFGRLVLSRLGPLYGQINLQLRTYADDLTEQGAIVA